MHRDLRRRIPDACMGEIKEVLCEMSAERKAPLSSGGNYGGETHENDILTSTVHRADDGSAIDHTCFPNRDAAVDGNHTDDAFAKRMDIGDAVILNDTSVVDGERFNDSNADGNTGAVKVQGQLVLGMPTTKTNSAACFPSTTTGAGEGDTISATVVSVTSVTASTLAAENLEQGNPAGENADDQRISHVAGACGITSAEPDSRELTAVAGNSEGEQSPSLFSIESEEDDGNDRRDGRVASLSELDDSFPSTKSSEVVSPLGCTNSRSSSTPFDSSSRSRSRSSSRGSMQQLQQRQQELLQHAIDEAATAANELLDVDVGAQQHETPQGEQHEEEAKQDEGQKEREEEKEDERVEMWYPPMPPDWNIEDHLRSFRNTKVEVHLSSVGGAPRLRVQAFSVAGNETISTVISFLKQALKTNDLFIYINSAIQPEADEYIYDLFQKFGVGGRLVLSYSNTPAF